MAVDFGEIKPSASSARGLIIDKAYVSQSHHAGSNKYVTLLLLYSLYIFI